MFSYRRPFLLAVIFILSLGFPARGSGGATILVLQFHNGSQYSDLNWVGESVSETVGEELSAQNYIVFGRNSRTEALRRLSLRPGADFTKASLIRLGQSLDADYVCYGTFDATLPAGSSELKNSSIQLSAHIIDLRKLHDGPDLAEAGRLTDLSRIEEHLVWQCLKYLEPSSNLPLDRFLAPAKLTRVDAEESYIRGLLSPNKGQQQKWFMQALALDPQFANPAYELGKLALERTEYRQAISWLLRISPSDPRYPEARFKMGLAAYDEADYGAAANYFREIAKAFPLNEVYNNLGAAENRLNQPNAVDDFRRALDGDPNDTVYLFNLANALLKADKFDEASRRFQTLLSREPDDAEVHDLLGRAQRHEFSSLSGKPVGPDRLKEDFDVTAFRQLKAMMQPKAGS